jgi:serine/threonine protein kinase
LLRAHGALGDFLETPASLVSAGPKLGARIGRYQLCEKLGEGGVGIVFLAEQEEPFRRKVALKVIKPGMDTREVIARFESERQALALMEHPHIARVFDAGTTAAGRPFFVMELVAGLPCTRFCDEERLTIEERLALFVKICRAIAHANAKGIIHRDIKPPNILVSQHEGTPVPKVIDFGIAKATEFKLTEKTLVTTQAHFMGTPSYMSPEQAGLGSQPIDARSDVYSLGVLLYELLVGCTPFNGPALASAGPDEIRRRIRGEEPALPSARLAALEPQPLAIAARNRRLEPAQLLTHVRGQLEWIILRCLEKEPSRRFESANVLADDVGRYLRRERVVTMPPSALARWKSYARNHGAARWLGAAAAAAVEGWRFARRTDAERETAAGPSDVIERTFEAEVRAATRGRTQDVEADRAYVEGRNALDRMTKDDIERGIACFERAIARDKKFALAWVGLSMAHEAMAKWGDDGAFDASFEIARRAAATALTLEPELADAHVAAAKVQMGYDWDWRGADASLRRALAFGPTNANVWVAAAVLAMNLGQRERALLFGHRAIELEPGLLAAHQFLALIHLVFGELEEAEIEARRMLTLSPESELSHCLLCWSAVQRSQLDRALEFAQKEKDQAFRLTFLAIVYHARGSKVESDAALAELVRDHEAQASYQIAQVHGFRGEIDAAFIWLEWAYRRHDAGLGYTKVDPWLRQLHRDSRWPALLRRLRLDD